MMRILQNKGKNLAALCSCLSSTKVIVKVQSKLVEELGQLQTQRIEKEEGGLRTLLNLAKVQINYLAGKQTTRCTEVDLIPI